MVKRIGDGFIIATVLVVLLTLLSFGNFDFFKTKGSAGPGSAITGFAVLENLGPQQRQGTEVEQILDSSCYDSDNYNGLTDTKAQIYTKGHVSFYGISHTDVCGRDVFFNHVYEQVCEPASMELIKVVIPSVKILECTGGTTCIQGECV